MDVDASRKGRIFDERMTATLNEFEALHELMGIIDKKNQIIAVKSPNLLAGIPKGPEYLS